MATSPNNVDDYLAEGCGRCARFATPECSAHVWGRELTLLRNIVLECGLTETIKWSHPCYMSGKRNVLLVSAFREYCCLAFFDGAELSDPEGLLVKPGEHTQAGRQIRFTDIESIRRLAPVLKAYILEATERAGNPPKEQKKAAPATLDVPDELEAVFSENPAFRMAFTALTPGRQRGYLMYFSQAKQSATRSSRIEKCIPQIMSGKGLQE